MVRKKSCSQRNLAAFLSDTSGEGQRREAGMPCIQLLQ